MENVINTEVCNSANVDSNKKGLRHEILRSVLQLKLILQRYVTILENVLTRVSVEVNRTGRNVSLYDVQVSNKDTVIGMRV